MRLYNAAVRDMTGDGTMHKGRGRAMSHESDRVVRLGRRAFLKDGALLLGSAISSMTRRLPA